MRLRSGLPSLRNGPLARVVFGAFHDAKERFGARLVQFSVQSNHLHMLVEVDEHRALGRAMKGLAVRIARRLNGALDQRGRVFSDRYHARALRTPLEVRRALVYVLRNCDKHSANARRSSHVDPLSTAVYFDGFTASFWAQSASERAPPEASAPVARPKTWLLSVGWRRLGLLEAHDTPSVH
ncbi:MAG TPA: transposase [Polyangiaceae bacterium]|jgi:REP element-mobilizing transposase RayT|nr:transposase [Polyangiaceae bacterium]